MKFSNIVIDFIFSTLGVCICAYFGAYFRLYFMAKMNSKKVFVIATFVFIALEFFLVYHFFFRET